MRKTFKKSIAVLLAVLMVVFSVPFTALAAPGDYTPNINLEFGTCSNIMYTGLYAGEGAYDSNTTSKNTDAVDSLALAGLYGAPIDYNKNTGTLTLQAAKTEGFATFYELDAATEDYTYGVGDYFMVTVTLENTTMVKAFETRLAFSDNIEPAGVYGYGTTTKRYYAFKGISDIDGTEKATSQDALAPVAAQSAESFYTMNTVAGDLSEIDADAKTLHLVDVTGSQYDDTSLLESDADAPFFSPVDGSAGYNYENTAILETFMFKITGEGPITFEIEDPDNSKYTDFTGGYLQACAADTSSVACITTYAINTWIAAGDFSGPENPGSRKMTFMGTNSNVESQECTHTNTEVQNKVDATCTTDGYTGDTVCLDCGETIATGTTIPATGHTPVSADNAVAATCTTDGKEADTVCSVCGETLSTGTTIPALGHDYTSVVTTDPTCTEAGVTTWTCTRCGDSYTTDEPAATGHTEVDIPAVAATCTTDGATAGVKCSVCGEILVAPTVVPALGHDYTSVVTTDPTCTEAGATTWTCTRCGDSYTTAEPAATGHTEVEIPAVEATCTTDGATAGTKCSVCGEILVAPTVVPALGHDFSVVVSSTAGDCQTVGTTTYKCSRCDATNVVEGAYGPHTEVSADNAVAATCTTDGKESDTVCSVCGITLTVGATIPATGHTPVSADNAVAATCTTDGKEADTVCSVCGETLAVGATIPALGHDYVEVENSAVAPTCTVAGKEADQKCSRCGDVITGAEIPATGHTPVSADNAVAATCVDDGKEADTVCSVCGETLAVGATIPATGHTPGEPVETTIKEATCTEKGYKNTTVTCTVCGAELSSVDEELSETGHTAGDPVVVTVPATVDADGSITTTVSCTVCGAELDKDVQVIPMLASYNVTVDATDLGTVTLNGADVTEGATVKVEAGKTFTLTATPVEGATFLGWKANGATTVSTATTYRTTALADVTYTPVFEIENESTFAVQFVDAFGNIVSAQQVASGADIVVPTAPTRPGYEAATENGWSMTNDEIAALTASATITAQYTKAAETLYTITATGCDITANGETVQDTVSVPYDTKVTVTSAGAKAWEVNGVAVGYGESYTFFVTADIELVPVANAVVETPSVANVGVGTIGATGKIQAVFKATRTMTDDCKYISSGFVYGNGDLGEITLDDVDGSAVKAAYTKTSVEQFTLTYGLRAQSGTITARAFLAYVDANGDNVVIYADPMTYTYA